MLLSICIFTALAVALWAVTAVITSYIGTGRAMIYTPLGIGVVTFCLIEGLSLGHAVSRISLTVVVAVFAVVLAGMYRRVWSGTRQLGVAAKAMITLAWSRDRTLRTWIVRLGLAAASVSVLVTLVIAVSFAPNNYDSLAYHLPRMMSWLQNSSVEYFATNNSHQLDIPPLAEYFALIVLGVTGSDAGLNLIQFFAFAWIVIAAAVIVRKIVSTPQAVAVALIMVISSQTILLEASTTQVDLVSSLWVVAAIAVVVGFLQHDMGPVEASGLFAAIVLLSATTKPTALVFLIPLAVWLGLLMLIRPGTPLWRRALTLVATAAVSLAGLAIGLLPQTLRNLDYFGNAFGSHTYLLIEKHSVNQTILGIARLLMNNVGLSLDRASDQIIAWLTGLFHADWVDPSAVIFGHEARLTSLMGGSEDYARSPFQLLGGIIVGILVLVLAKRAGGSLVGLSVVFLSLIVVMSATFKWNLWTNRFYIPLFFLGAVIIAGAFGRLANSSRTWPQRGSMVLATFALVSACVGMLVDTHQMTRPLMQVPSLVTSEARNLTYFGGRGELAGPILNLVDELNAVPDDSTVWIYAEPEEPVYILWALANSDHRLTFVATENLNLSPERGTDIYIACMSVCPADADGPYSLISRESR